MSVSVKPALALPFLCALVIQNACGQLPRPQLVLTAADVQSVRESTGRFPLFDKALQEAKQTLEAALAGPIDVPVPKDAGGYTHERHKQNYREMQLAGTLFAFTNDARYAQFVRDMLLKYSVLYPTLKQHPMGQGEAVGKIFWQTLNEAVWLVHAAQAYDCVYEWLTKHDRDIIESQLFRPMAEFFTVKHAREHDRIHNHGTWTVAATGMLGFALHDSDLVDKALYGTRRDGSGGFIRQLDLLFSPDGYYTEGPYYARYALMPFFLFAQAIEHNRPRLRIFEYRGQILRKSLYAALQQTFPNGRFIPFNDALKGMSVRANELMIALDITYSRYGEDAGLLSIAKVQDAVMLSGAGLAVAKGMAQSSAGSEFTWKSLELTDGPKGDEGGVGILRSGPPSQQSLVLMKYTSHGKSHGHFDKLEILYWDQEREILQDYGAVRFVNVEQKDGGRYLPETMSWARQTIAHNTVTVDGRSQYQGMMSMAERYHADRHFFSATDPNVQVMSAKVSTAYPGIALQRTIAMIRAPGFSTPVIVDIFRVAATQRHQYDLPFYFLGHLISTNVKYVAYDRHQVTIGDSNGYQHLWKAAEGKAEGPVQVVWLSGTRFYSVTTAADTSTRVYFMRIGAGDPDFNLRNEPAFMLRQRAASHVFASVIEPHGSFDPVSEISSEPSGIVSDVSVIGSTDEGSVIEISGRNLRMEFMVGNGDASDTAVHTVSVGGKNYTWTGNYFLRTF